MAGGQIALILAAIVCALLVGAIAVHLYDSWRCVHHHHVEDDSPAA